VRRIVAGVAATVALWAAPGAWGAGWCGNGEVAAERPNAVTGPQVHAIYAVPSDGVDNFATVANEIADDATAIGAWWRTQDPTREPRFDQAAFGGCVGLDISMLRLAIAAAELTGPEASRGWQRISLAVARAGFSRSYTKYLVYYDGPSSPGTCGSSNGEFSRAASWSVVWMQACPGVDLDVVAVHELIHALGALPNGAPHPCSDLDRGHPCDAANDILWPIVNHLPLAEQVLDVGRDDYYAHAGSWNDLQDSVWLRHTGAGLQSLSVALQGAGHVLSDLPGLDCAASCSTGWDSGMQVRLTAFGVGGKSRFVGWRGACTGPGECALTLDRALAVTAIFGPVTIPVRVTTAGRGRVVCTPACRATMSAGIALRLRAVAAKGWRFAGWSGACRGTRDVCAPSTDNAVTVRATFRRPPA
jgi:hypothetical protein